jgi:predicted DNA-binding transcriptional regulator AlpA
MAQVLPPNPGKRLLSIPFVARHKLGISPRKLWELIAAHHFHPVKIGVRGTRLLEDEVDAYIEKLAKDQR